MKIVFILHLFGLSIITSKPERIILANRVLRPVSSVLQSLNSIQISIEHNTNKAFRNHIYSVFYTSHINGTENLVSKNFLREEKWVDEILWECISYTEITICYTEITLRMGRLFQYITLSTSEVPLD